MSFCEGTELEGLYEDYRREDSFNQNPIHNSLQYTFIHGNIYEFTLCGKTKQNKKTLLNTSVRDENIK